MAIPLGELIVFRLLSEIPCIACGEDIFSEDRTHDLEIFHDDFFSLFLEYSTDLRLDECAIDTEKLHEESEKIGILIFISDLESEKLYIFRTDEFLHFWGEFLDMFRIRDEIPSRTKGREGFFYPSDIESDEDIEG